MAAIAIASEASDTIQVTCGALEAEALQASVTGDPAAGMLRAYAMAFRAQQQLLAQTAQVIENAKLPVDTDMLRLAVRDGIRAHAATTVRALNWRNVIAAAVALVVCVAVGFAGGWLLSQNQLVVVAGLGDALRAKDAAAWVGIIKHNPRIAECHKVRVDDSREACAVWVTVME